MGNAERAATVVVIEDEVDIASAIDARLRSEGFDVVLAHDGPGGIHAVAAHEPDIVVLDLMLPGLGEADQSLLRSALGCPPEDDRGWAGWNLGVERAEDARAQLCRA